MSAHVTLTGNLGRDPETRFTPQGQAVTTLSVACTRARKNRQTGQWEDDGDPLWITAAFWGQEHTYLADTLRKGDKVSLDGDLIRRAYTTRDGRAGESLELRYPRLLGIVPRPPQPGQPTGGYTSSSPQAQQAASPAAQAWGAPAAPGGGQDGDPWAFGANAGTDTSTPPF